MLAHGITPCVEPDHPELGFDLAPGPTVETDLYRRFAARRYVPPEPRMTLPGCPSAEGVSDQGSQPIVMHHPHPSNLWGCQHGVTCALLIKSAPVGAQKGAMHMLYEFDDETVKTIKMALEETISASQKEHRALTRVGRTQMALVYSRQIAACTMAIDEIDRQDANRQM